MLFVLIGDYFLFFLTSLTGSDIFLEYSITNMREIVIYSMPEDAFKYLDKPMLNLTGINNTDLKLEYGSANLNTIIEYEQNYQNLLENLFKWGDSLHKANRIDDAILVLEKGVNIESYLSKNYILLADLYKKTNQKNKLIELKEIVNKKTSDNLMFKKVINHINNLLTEV